MNNLVINLNWYARTCISNICKCICMLNSALSFRASTTFLYFSSFLFLEFLAANGTAVSSWIYYKPVNFSRVPFSLISPLLLLLASSVVWPIFYYPQPLFYVFSRHSPSPDAFLCPFCFLPSLLLLFLTHCLWLTFSLRYSRL